MRARVAVVVAERERMYAALVQRGMPVVPSQANFLWLDVPDTAVELALHGERLGVVKRSFADVGVRVTIGTAAENDRVLDVLDSARSAGLI